MLQTKRRLQIEYIVVFAADPAFDLLNDFGGQVLVIVFLRDPGHQQVDIFAQIRRLSLSAADFPSFFGDMEQVQIVLAFNETASRGWEA